VEYNGVYSANLTFDITNQGLTTAIAGLVPGGSSVEVSRSSIGADDCTEGCNWKVRSVWWTIGLNKRPKEGAIQGPIKGAKVFNKGPKDPNEGPERPNQVRVNKHFTGYLPMGHYLSTCKAVWKGRLHDRVVFNAQLFVQT
jgi:hypothetical protein